MRAARLIGSVAALIAAACTATEPPAGGGEPHRQRPPNILIVVTDDQRFDMMGALPETRRLFGRGGVAFTNSYATTPQCCPARASIMTGRYSHNHGVLENKAGGLIDHGSTIQARLKRAGYSTAITGKFLQGIPVSEDPPFFDLWATSGYGYYDARFNVNGDMRTIRRYSTDHMAATTVRWLRVFERYDDQPWFIYVAPQAPHLPYVPPPRYEDAPVPRMRRTPAATERSLADKPPYFGDPRISDKTGFTLAEGRALYERQMRTLMAVDDLVARVFRVLDRLGEGDDTLAFFTSDNGHLLGEHGLFGKRLPYEASIRVPLFMRWPARLESGTRDTRLVAGIDIAPTIVDAAGLGPEEPAMDGSSLLGDHARTELLLEQYINGWLPDWVSLVTADNQYVEYIERDTHERLYAEFYDLGRDRWQMRNLLEHGRPIDLETAERAAERLASLRDCSGGDCP